MDKEKRASAKRADRSKQEDVVLNRVLVWFGGAVLAEFLLLFLNRYYINYRTTEIDMVYVLFKAMPVLIFAGLIGAALCALWFFLRKKQGKRAMLPGILLGVFAGLFVICATAWQFAATGVQFLCGAVPAVAVLALVFYLYQKEFFLITLLSALGIVGLWVLRKANGAHEVIVYGYMALVAVALVGIVLLCRKLQQSGGAWGKGEAARQLFSRNANYGMVYLTCGVVAAALIAALALGLGAAYYLIFVLVAWLFAMAVLFTVKLM